MREKDSSLFLCKDNFENRHWQHGLKVQQAEIALKTKAKKITLSTFPSSAFSHSKCHSPGGPSNLEVPGAYSCYIILATTILSYTQPAGGRRSGVSLLPHGGRDVLVSHFYFHANCLLVEEPLSLPLLWCGCGLSGALFLSSKEGVFRAWVTQQSPSLGFLPMGFQAHGRHCPSRDRSGQGKVCGHGRMRAAHCSPPRSRAVGAKPGLGRVTVKHQLGEMLMLSG